MKKGPKKLTIDGALCEKQGEPMKIKGWCWETYVPVQEHDERIFERETQTGQIIRTK